MSVGRHSKSETRETSCLIFSLRSASFCSLVFDTRTLALGSGSGSPSSLCGRLRLTLPFFLETDREARSSRVFCPDVLFIAHKVAFATCRNGAVPMPSHTSTTSLPYSPCLLKRPRCYSTGLVLFQAASRPSSRRKASPLISRPTDGSYLGPT